MYDEIINFNEKFTYKRFKKTNNYSDSYLVDDKYILKITNNKTKTQFDLIVKIIQNLNEKNFPTAKCLFSKYKNNKSYFVFEYIRGDKITKDKKYIKDISNLINLFYDMTKDFEIEKDNCLLYQAHKMIISINNDKYKQIFIETIEKLKKNQNNLRLIITDVNTSNFIIKDNKLYLIDFDEVLFGEIEFDLADFIEDYFNLNIETLDEKVEDIKFLLESFEINSEKIIDYLISILIFELNFNSYNKKRVDFLEYVLENKETLMNKLSFINS